MLALHGQVADPAKASKEGRNEVKVERNRQDPEGEARRAAMEPQSI